MEKTFIAPFLSFLSISLDHSDDNLGTRSDLEVIIFILIQGILMLIRFFAILYFILMAIKHSKFQGEKKDIFTYLTFVFLAISQLFQNLVFLPNFVKTIIDLLSRDEPNKY
jgi:hypothetical protein